MSQENLTNEKILLQRISDGDAGAFRTLFDDYKERFYAVSYKMTRSEQVAQDIVQEIFLNLWQRRETLCEIKNPSGYFFTIVYRMVHRHYRKIAFEKKYFDQATSPETTESPEISVLCRETGQKISDAIRRLPKQQQIIFTLARQHGLTRQEISNKLALSPHTVKNHLAAAIKNLQLALKDLTIVFPIFFRFFFSD